MRYFYSTSKIVCLGDDIITAKTTIRKIRPGLPSLLATVATANPWLNSRQADPRWAQTGLLVVNAVYMLRRRLQTGFDTRQQLLNQHSILHTFEILQTSQPRSLGGGRKQLLAYESATLAPRAVFMTKGNLSEVNH